MTRKSILQECPTRVSYKSVIWTYVAFRTCLHSGSWAPSCSLFSFMSFCLRVSSFSCAYYRPDLSLYTYTHAYSTYNEVQVAQVRYNEVWIIGCPSSLGSSSSATTHTFVCLVLFIFICLFCVHMCLASFPGRMEATHASLRGGVCVYPRESKGTFRFGTGAYGSSYPPYAMKLRYDEGRAD